MNTIVSFRLPSGRCFAVKVNDREITERWESSSLLALQRCLTSILFKALWAVELHNYDHLNIYAYCFFAVLVLGDISENKSFVTARTRTSLSVTLSTRRLTLATSVTDLGRLNLGEKQKQRRVLYVHHRADMC